MNPIMKTVSLQYIGWYAHLQTANSQELKTKQKPSPSDATWSTQFDEQKFKIPIPQTTWANRNPKKTHVESFQT